MIISNLLKKSEHLKKLLLNQNNDLSEKNIFSSMNNLEQILGEIMLGDSFISSINSSNISFENGLFSNTQDTENDNISIVDILNDLIQNESVQGAIDVDTNGTLSNEEITEFLEALEGLDENPDDISINDVLSAVESISNGTFAEETNENPDTEDEIALADTVKETNQANRANRASRKSGSTRNSGANSADATGSQATTPQNMSLEELQSKKTEKEAEVKTAQDKVNAAQTGETEAIKSAQADCDEKKLAYEEAIKNDENISNELKTQQQTNQASLDSQKKVVDGVKVDINNKENEIISQNSVITQDKSKISALESSISNLESESSDNEDVKADIASKLSAAKKQLSEAKEKLSNDEAKLEELKTQKNELETKLTEEEKKVSDIEAERQTIESSILANCAPETKIAMEAFKAAEENVKAVKESELTAAKAEQTKAQNELNEINQAINSKSAQKIEKEFAVNSLENPEQLYKTMGLEEKGLNYEVFLKAIEGYNNLSEKDKEKGYLGIFDTTQSSDKKRYYLLDLNNFELVGQSVMKTGSGNMDNVQSANRPNSHATLSGFEKVGKEYYSNSMKKQAIRLIGLEEGINDNAESKGTVIHYTVNEHTWGCKGFPPVKSNGKINKEATYDLMRDLFPTGSIVYTHPTDDRYWQLSDLYA